MSQRMTSRRVAVPKNQSPPNGPRLQGHSAPNLALELVLPPIEDVQVVVCEATPTSPRLGP
jgi:hypothetical protein